MEELPQDTAVMDPLHVVRLGANALNECRRRAQQETHSHRGRRGDLLYDNRHTLLTGADLLTDRQRDHVTTALAPLEHAAVEATWGDYQHMISAYRAPNRAGGKKQMNQLITRIATRVPAALPEPAKLGHTLNKRRTNILTYCDHPGTSNSPTEAINSPHEHLRGTALGFRNLTHYITRSLLETGGFKPHLHREL